MSVKQFTMYILIAISSVLVTHLFLNFIHNDQQGATVLPSTINVKDWELPNNDSGIVIYTASWCSACSALKSYLNERDIKYANVDIEKVAGIKDKLNTNNLKKIPLIVINGTMIEGFDIKLLEDKLNLVSTNFN